MEWKSFYIEKEPCEQGKFYIGVKIVIYRAKLRKYPDFLARYEYDDPRDGYSTKFAYLVDGATGLTEDEAQKLCAELESKYSKIIRECENSGDWSNSPFDFSKMTLLWSK